MPVVEDEEGKVIYDPNPAPGSYQLPAPGPPPGPAPGNFGMDAAGPGFPGVGAPGVPNPLAPPPGLRGRSRFENEVNRRTFTGGLWADEFNQWVLSLPEDPLDPEYNAVLRWARDQARQKLAEATRLRKEKEEARNLRIRRAGGKDRLAAQEGDFIPAPGEPEKTTKPFRGPQGYEGQPSTTRHMTERKEHGFEVPSDATSAAKAAAAGPDGPSEEEQLRAENAPSAQRKREAAEWGRPRFKGLPITAADLFGNPLGATSGDPDLDAFMSENGIVLNPYTANKAVMTGQYVYFGQEYNETLNTSRDVYMFTDQAKSSGVDPKLLPPALISQYQKDMGLPVTGRVEGELKQLWDKAVDYAVDLIKTGQKISPKEVFTVWVQSLIEQYKASGGRGGGGGGGARMETFDYYRAMMQVLGDISGVGQVQ